MPPASSTRPYAQCNKLGNNDTRSGGDAEIQRYIPVTLLRIKSEKDKGAALQMFARTAAGG